MMPIVHVVPMDPVAYGLSGVWAQWSLWILNYGLYESYGLYRPGGPYGSNGPCGPNEAHGLNGPLEAHGPKGPIGLYVPYRVWTQWYL